MVLFLFGISSTLLITKNLVPVRASLGVALLVLVISKLHLTIHMLDDLSVTVSFGICSTLGRAENVQKSWHYQ